MRPVDHGQPRDRLRRAVPCGERRRRHRLADRRRRALSRGSSCSASSACSCTAASTASSWTSCDRTRRGTTARHRGRRRGQAVREVRGHADAGRAACVAAAQPQPAQQPLGAARDVDFDVAAGECVGVIGRNGSGKSTLLQMLAGVTAPTEGSVTVRGRVAPLISRRRRLPPRADRPRERLRQRHDPRASAAPRSTPASTRSSTSPRSASSSTRR